MLIILISNFTIDENDKLHFIDLLTNSLYSSLLIDYIRNYYIYICRIMWICMYVYIYVYNVYMYVCVYIYIPVILIKLLIFYYHRLTFYCSNNRLLASLIQIKANIIQELSVYLFLCILIQFSIGLCKSLTFLCKINGYIMKRNYDIQYNIFILDLFII